MYLFAFILLFGVAIYIYRAINSKPTVSSGSEDDLYTSSNLKEIQSQVENLIKLPDLSNSCKGKYLFLDTETTGLPQKRNASPSDTDNWPYVVQLAWILTDENGFRISNGNYIIKQNVVIPQNVINIHHISNEIMQKEGKLPSKVYSEFIESLNNCEYIIAHNVAFDLPILQCELIRNGFSESLYSKKSFCTMNQGVFFCSLLDRSGRNKKPKLLELFGELYFDNPFINISGGLHDAMFDTILTYRCFIKMIEKSPKLIEMGTTYVTINKKEKDISEEKELTLNEDHIYIVGGFYCTMQAKEYIMQMNDKDIVYFLPEPNNPYDKNAILVCSPSGMQIGYVGRNYNIRLLNLLNKKLVIGKLSGSAFSSYEYAVTLDECRDMEAYENAISILKQKKISEYKAKEKFNKQISMNYSEKMDKAVFAYEMKRYDKVYEIIKPFFDEDIAGATCYELALYMLHMEKNYKEEAKLLDEYLASDDVKTPPFWKRRKFHILREIGDIVSNEQIDNDKVGVETTVQELDAFSVVVNILSDMVDINRIDYRDSRTLFSINLDDNNRKPICKLYLNNQEKLYIGLIGDNKEIIKKSITCVDDINLYSTELRNTLQTYLNFQE